MRFDFASKVMFSLLLLFCLNSAASTSASVSASVSAIPSDVTLAGFAFAGEFKDIKTRYPYTWRISEELKARDSGKKAGDNFENLSYQLIKRAAVIYNPALNLTPIGELVNLREQALMSVLVITGETVLTERFGDYTKIFIRLRGDARIFDYKNKQIVLNYPIGVQRIDIIDGNRQPTDAEITAHIKKNLFDSGPESLFSQYIQRMSDAVIPAPGTRTLQVNRVVIAPEALDMFPENLRSDTKTLQDMLSGEFTCILAARAKVPILPAKADQTVGAMHMKLENSDEQIEILPGEGDYLFDISLLKYRKQEYKKTKFEVTYLYGILVALDFYEPLSREHFFDNELKNAEFKTHLLKTVSGDDFPAFWDTLRRLFMKFSDAVKTGDTEWIEIATSAPNADKKARRTHKRDTALKLQKIRKTIDSTR